jgi:adenine-specific DNA-methyltransferase
MKQKLELTWVGKDIRPSLEPRVLLLDEEKSFTASARVTDHDVFDNRLIFGDNLLALKALEQELAGKVKCVYIDPPFNTKQALDYYDDGLEHSIWLELMRNRLEIIYKIISNDGSLFVHIDDNEIAYLVVILDEIFGRNNRISIVTFKQGAATGHKSINPGMVSTSNFILLYAKNKSDWKPNRIFTSLKNRDKRYGQFIKNYDSGITAWEFTTLSKAFADYLNLPEKNLKKTLGDDFEEKISKFVIENATKVTQLANPDYSAISKSAREMIDISRENPNSIYKLEREGLSDMFFIGGKRILFYSDKLKYIDGEYVAGEPLTTIWDDLLSNNLHNEGEVDFPKSKKPESLIKRCLELSTQPGDLVLDSFAGSGTTGAVAHKMGRRWIMVELKDHANTHIVPRMQRVIDGTDQGGISSSVGWKGGGGFRYYHLAKSVLKKDKWDNWIINPEFNADRLSEAMCKIEGYAYSPSSSDYWNHGYGTENNFIFVTTQYLSLEQLQSISEEVGAERSLLVMASSFAGGMDFPNLILKKIPQSVLHKCEWDHDDYSLKIENLPMQTSEPAEVKHTRKPKDTGVPNLFNDGGKA